MSRITNFTPYNTRINNSGQTNDLCFSNEQKAKENDLTHQMKVLLMETANHTSFHKVALWIINKLEEIDAKIECMNNLSIVSEIDKWMSLRELSEYMPSHPAAQTIYGWTSNHLIPFHKKGKRIMFLKSEIDTWLNGEKYKSKQELEEEAKQFIVSKKKSSFQTRYSLR